MDTIPVPLGLTLTDLIDVARDPLVVRERAAGPGYVAAYALLDHSCHVLACGDIDEVAHRRNRSMAAVLRLDPDTFAALVALHDERSDAVGEVLADKAIPAEIGRAA